MSIPDKFFQFTRTKLSPVIFLFLMFSGVFVSCQPTKNAKENSGNDIDKRYKYEDYAGLWLLPQIRDTVYSGLRSRGLNLSQKEIYDRNGPSLNRAVAQINIGESNGGTGSFVSPKGLILSTRGSALQAITSSSTINKNYLEKGFYAEKITEEIPAQDYSLLIPLEQVDITGQIEQRVPDTLTYQQRQQYRQKVRKVIADERLKADKNLKVEIKDLWAGNKQYMFVYKIIRDVRVVHVPPMHNNKQAGPWDSTWPRYSGNYAFLRAYVAPDGSSRTYNPENVPYRPEKYFRIGDEEITEGDFTMTLGFPGSTFRNESSLAFQFYHENLNPVLMQLQEILLNAAEYAAGTDPQKKLKSYPRRASLSQALDYYQTVQKGFGKHNIIDQKKKQEQKLQEWIEQDSMRKITHREIFERLEQSYRIASQSVDLLYATLYPLNENTYIQLAGMYDSYYQYLNNPGGDTMSPSQKESFIKRHKSVLDSVNAEAQRTMLADMLYVLANLPEGKKPLFLLDFMDPYNSDSLKDDIRSFISLQEKKSIVFNPQKAANFLNLPGEKAKSEKKDDMIQLYRGLRESFTFARKNYLKHMPYLNPAQKRYVNAMLQYNKELVPYPDANATLRVSGGKIKGYRTNDTLFYEPVTFYADLMKTEDYDYIRDSLPGPEKLRDKVGSMAVNFMTTNDVTRGGFGSPVLNGNGRLVGIAIDVNEPGFVSDYIYNPALKRTININIRYLLFLMGQVYHTKRLLREMSVDQ